MKTLQQAFQQNICDFFSNIARGMREMGRLHSLTAETSLKEEQQLLTTLFVMTNSELSLLKCLLGAKNCPCQRNLPLAITESEK